MSAPRPAPAAWRCACGGTNPMALRLCTACGEPRPGAREIEPVARPAACLPVEQPHDAQCCCVNLAPLVAKGRERTRRAMLAWWSSPAGQERRREMKAECTGRPAAAPVRHTRAIDAAIRSGRRRGYSFAELADHIGVSVPVCRRMARELGLSTRRLNRGRIPGTAAVLQ